MIIDIFVCTTKLFSDVLMYNSADEGFDGTYPTNVVVRSNGSCVYIPPGAFNNHIAFVLFLFSLVFH